MGTVWARAGLVGFALGVTFFAGGALILFDASQIPRAAAGLTATASAALAAGFWAGMPGDGSVHSRWLLSGLSVAGAGAYATLLAILTALGRVGEMRSLALLFLIALPAYGIGFLIPALTDWTGRMLASAGGEEDERGLGAATLILFALLLGGAAGSLLAGLFLIPNVDAGPLLLGMAAVLTSPILLPWGPEPGPEEREVHRLETAYHTLRVVETTYPGAGRQPDRVLYLDEEIESGELARTGAPTFAYIAAADRWLADLSSRGERYLFLGGGAYTLPRRVAERDPAARVTVVERDPEVTHAAYTFFGLRPEHGIVSVHGDARVVVAEWGRAAFDRVFMDIYDGRETIPYSMVTAEAFAALGALLLPGGLAAVNVIGVAEGEGSRRFWSVVRTAAAVFPSLALYHHLGRDYPERQNFLLTLSTERDRRFPVRAGAFDCWPREEWPLEGSIVLRDRSVMG